MACDLDHLPRFRFHPQRDKIVMRYVCRTFEGEVGRRDRQGRALKAHGDLTARPS
ncbi:MAG TPA: hypothetical protein VH249_15320 [Xanthobacteraceae bacterium]|jgi:hypothetical protein|nr:hypothetical protein [Xanthobacteraceae bacterium]